MSEFKIGAVNSDFVNVINKVSSIVHQISGNRLGEKQAFMVETRAKKRMLELGIKEAKDYLKHIEKHVESESGILVGLITTHHTFFFREFLQFEVLQKNLPAIVENAKKRGSKTLNVWSAACSRGQEVYSLAMFLDYYLREIDPSMDFKILGTDIDIESIKVATNGVYHQNEINEIPMKFLGANWAKGTNEISMYAKFKNTLKSKCSFKSGNLLKISESVSNEKYDVIFCRNVFIYFEPYQIEQITKDLMDHLQPQGIIFTGISEPLSGLKVSVDSVGPSSYTFKSEGFDPRKKVPSSDMLVDYNPRILKVMCVDDSSSILTLLKKVLTKEQGFEVVATAINGKDAVEKLKTVKVDLMTLDIHMPEMDGVTYLEKNFNKSHPPVIIISSASRSDSDFAMKALKFGASDYIEKPALSNLEEQGEEIRTKMRSIVKDSDRKNIISSYDKESQKKYAILKPEKKMRAILASISDLLKIKYFFNELDNSQPSIFVFFEGQNEILGALIEEHKKDFKQQIVLYEGPNTKIEPNKIYFADFKSWYLEVHRKYTNYPSSLLVLGCVSKHSARVVSEWKNAQLLLEDLGEQGNDTHPLKAFSTDVVPATSFSYMSCRYLSTK